RQREIAEHAGEEHRDGQQGRGDRPRDERRGNVHWAPRWGAAGALVAWGCAPLAPLRGGWLTTTAEPGFRRSWPESTINSPGATPTVARWRVSSSRRMLTKPPGHKRRRALGNAALSLIVPVVGSIWLSISSNSPWSSSVLPLGSTAMTGNFVSSMRPVMAARC